jgi:hypothetical protein
MFSSSHSEILRKSILLLLLLVVAGCGASNETPTTLTSGLTSTEVNGLLDLGGPVQGAQVTFLDASGTTLAQPPVVTGSDGRFRAESLFPATFRVRAAVPQSRARALNQAGTFEAVTHVSSASRELTVLNAVTTLTSLYQAKHPELTLAQCEARVKEFLEIPSYVNVRWQLDGNPYAHFLHDVFCAKAELNGGIDAFLQQLLLEIDQGGTQVFSAAGAGDPPFWGPILVGATQRLTKGVATTTLKWGLGRMAAVLGWNFGVSGALREIAQELQQLSNQISALQSTVDRDAQIEAVRNAYNSLENDIEPLAAPNQLLINQGLVADVTGAPGPANQNVVNLLDALGTLNSTGVIENLGRHLGQPNGLNNIYAQLVALQMTRAGVGTVFQPVLRSQLLSAPVDSAYNYYSGTMTQAVNLLSESAFGVAGGHLGPALKTALLEQRRALAFIRSWQLQVPPYLGNTLVDLEAGLMFHLAFEREETYSQTVKLSFCYTPVYNGYAGWRLATENDVKSLFARMQRANPKDPFTTLESVYGFNLAGISKDSADIWIGSTVNRVEPNTCNVTYDGSPRTFNLNSGALNYRRPTERYPYLYVRDIPHPVASTTSEDIQILLRVAGTLKGLKVSPGPQVAAPSGDSGTYSIVQASGTFEISTPKGSQTGDAFYSDRVVWTSSNPDIAEVSNLPNTPGLIQWRRTPNNQQPGPVTLVASNWPVQVDANGNVTADIPGTVFGKAIIQPPPVPSRTVEVLNITPINQWFTVIPPFTTQLYLTSFGSDGFIQDITQSSDAVWTVTDQNDNTLPTSEVEFSPNTPGLLVLKSGLSNGDLKVSVTYTFDGVPTQAETLLHVALP